MVMLKKLWNYKNLVKFHQIKVKRNILYDHVLIWFSRKFTVGVNSLWTHSAPLADVMTYAGTQPRIDESYKLCLTGAEGDAEVPDWARGCMSDLFQI